MDSRLVNPFYEYFTKRAKTWLLLVHIRCPYALGIITLGMGNTYPNFLTTM